MAALTFRNRDGKLVDVPTIGATQFKNEFGAVLEQAMVRGAIAITKHDSPKAVLLSYDEFQALTRSSTPVLDELAEQFDTLLQRMQTPQSKTGVSAAFNATPEELGRASVKAARRKPKR